MIYSFQLLLMDFTNVVTVSVMGDEVGDFITG